MMTSHLTEQMSIIPLNNNHTNNNNNNNNNPNNIIVNSLIYLCLQIHICWSIFW